MPSSATNDVDDRDLDQVVVKSSYLILVFIILIVYIISIYIIFNNIRVVIIAAIVNK